MTPIVTRSLDGGNPYDLTRSYFYDPAYWYEENWNNDPDNLLFHRWLAISGGVNWSAAAMAGGGEIIGTGVSSVVFIDLDQPSVFNSNYNTFIDPAGTSGLAIGVSAAATLSFGVKKFPSEYTKNDVSNDFKEYFDENTLNILLIIGGSYSSKADEYGNSWSGVLGGLSTPSKISVLFSDVYYDRINY